MRLIVKQISGLGNQLFQYAAGRYFATRMTAEMEFVLDPEKNAKSHGHPRPFLLNCFTLKAKVRQLSLLDRVVLAQRPTISPLAHATQQACGIELFREPIARRYTFIPDLPVATKTLYLSGYWQAYGYAAEVESELRASLMFREPALGKNAELLRRINDSEESISLHVRRGDYTLQAEGDIAMPMDYYRQGISFFRERYRKPTFFVFSDDATYVSKEFGKAKDFVFVDHNDSRAAHEDLRLMSSCRNHIIANSTFSWWGAWLNPSPSKLVFAPKYWHRRPESYYPDLIPPAWHLCAQI